jgi:hypothetical protein
MIDEYERDIWTFERHLAAGLGALDEITKDTTHPDAEPVCHHFYEFDPVDQMKVAREDVYEYLCAPFHEAGLEMLTDRLEAWETVKPDRAWLDERLASIAKLIEGTGLHYEGWSWEPRDRQPVSATNFLIINNRTP